MAVKAKPLDPHAVLKGEQRDASDPNEHVWLSASAGTGKTYVLSARVLRLLLRGVKPDAILCLTFTKAGAAEMAERVHARLAHWVQIEDTVLFKELEALGEPSGPDERAAARTLFAKVLESRGGGLRIMTIHAFCQTLLAGFPLEAGLSPGFRPLEGREQATLVQTVLAELVINAEREGDVRLLGDLSALSLRLGEAEAVAFLKRAAPALAALEELGPGLEAKVRTAMAVPLAYDPVDIATACVDGAFDQHDLFALAGVLAEWGARGQSRAEVISEWWHGTAEQRAADLAHLDLVWNKADGDLRTGKGQVPPSPAYEPMAQRWAAWSAELLGLQRRAGLARAAVAALNAARSYARAYADAKRVRGLVDFDDLIERTRALLIEDNMGEWIRFKLDQATDHILVDEAQDTNAAQWAIVSALAGEFWAGDGAKGAKLRTLFTVGDFKQAIYGFQGTDPEIYRAVGGVFAGYAGGARQEILRLSLNQSFRSTPPVLDVVDALLEEIGSEALGLDETAKPHESARGGLGEVLLLPPVIAENDTEDDGEETWIPSATRDLASTLAKQVKAWLAEPLWLAKDGGRALMPGDVMILVRKRSDLAALLVARLHEEGVPVAGVDRLKLQAPLAVQDLLAAMRFAAQPLDDLNLASLLVSPLIGWSQDELFALAHGRAGVLWDAVPPGDVRDALRDMLSAADNITPYAFLENLLSGALQGRKKLLARLGKEARDPIDELLNAAFQFERECTASLQQFLDWFDRGESEIVRDADAAGNAVRVMTVHGAKGLQAPLVILADACADPDKALERNFKWTIDGVVEKLPLFRPRSAERELVASLKESMDDADDKAKREHWRLLYVAMTRAEERLVIAGSLGPRANGVVPEASWHAMIERAMMRLEVGKSDDGHWGASLRYGTALSKPERIERSGNDVSDENSPSIARGSGLPIWLNEPAPQEARPPRPLAPSSIGQDDTPNPPPSAAMADAAERGRILHGLFERLPNVAADNRRARAAVWLEGIANADELAACALDVIENPDFSGIFSADALAEAPVAGVFDGLVIAGTIDRLIVTETLVEIVDFKTGRRVPPSADDIPTQHLRQMAAYAAVLEGIFPGREVRASLLYSEGPVIHRLSKAQLAAHKPRFAAAQDNLVTAG